MQFRDHPATAGKRDFYSIDPRKLKVDPDYNVRDLTTPEAVAELDQLEASIIANGVRVPLEVRLDGDDLYIVAGHRRLAAVMAAIAKGHAIKTVPAIPELKGVNSEERTLNLIISNSGKPLAPLEIAQVVARLRQFGWAPEQKLLGAEPDVREMVRQGDVSASTAVAVVRKNGRAAGEILRKAKAAAKPNKAGKKRVTGKSLHAAAGTKQLRPGQVQVLITVMHKIAEHTDEKRSCRAATDAISKLGL